MEVHVHNATRPHLGHGIPVEGRHLGELPRLDFIAAIFGEEHGDGVVAELFGARLIARVSIAGVAAPRVDVVSPEIDGLVVVFAVKVVGHVVPDIRHIRGGISHAHRAIPFLLDVGLHVANSGLDVRTGVRGRHGVGHLIAGEEPDGVVVLGQLIDDAGIPLVQIDSPRGIAAVDGLAGRRQVGDHVDASFGQQVHALGVVGRGIDVVCANHVGPQLLHQGDIALAGVDIGEGILGVLGCALLGLNLCLTYRFN